MSEHRTEKDAIEAAQTPATMESLLRDLRALGVKRGDTLIVHSSMSRLGWVCGREVAVIQVLRRAVGPFGRIVMPAHTGDNSDPAQWCNPPVPESWIPIIRENMPAYDRRMSPTRGIGRIAECFRRMPGVRRSAHPQVSWAACGWGASWLLHGHSFERPAFGERSPLKRMCRCNAKALLLGVGYGNCTALHMAETLWGGAPRVTVGAACKRHGRRVWLTSEEIDFDDEVFPEIGKAYEAEGGEARHGKAALAEATLVPIRPLIDFGVRWYRERAR